MIVNFPNIWQITTSEPVIIHRGEASEISQTGNNPYELLLKFGRECPQKKIRLVGVVFAAMVPLVMARSIKPSPLFPIPEEENWHKWCGLLRFPESSLADEMSNNDLIGSFFGSRTLFVYRNNIEDYLWLVCASDWEEE